MLAAAEAEEARVHPVAKAVFKWALTYSQHASSLPKGSVAETRSVERVLGKGVRCEVKGHLDEWTTVHVGQMAFLQENKISLPEGQTTKTTTASMVHFAFDGRYGGCLEVQDTVREEAPSVVSALLRNGLEVSMVCSCISLFAT
jgi:cation transport ATPase